MTDETIIDSSVTGILAPDSLKAYRDQMQSPDASHPAFPPRDGEEFGYGDIGFTTSLWVLIINALETPVSFSSPYIYHGDFLPSDGPPDNTIPGLRLGAPSIGVYQFGGGVYGTVACLSSVPVDDLVPAFTVGCMRDDFPENGGYASVEEGADAEALTAKLDDNALLTPHVFQELRLPLTVPGPDQKECYLAVSFQLSVTESELKDVGHGKRTEQATNTVMTVYIGPVDDDDQPTDDDQAAGGVVHDPDDGDIIKGRGRIGDPPGIA